MLKTLWRRIVARDSFTRLNLEMVPEEAVKHPLPLFPQKPQSFPKTTLDVAEPIAKKDISMPELPQAGLGLRIGELIDPWGRVESVLPGGMGIVYICRRVSERIGNLRGAGEISKEYQLDKIPQYKALKSFDRKYVGHADVVKRFRQEALLWISLPPHPNIVRAWTYTEYPLLILEYIDGGNLRAKIEAGSLSEDEVIRISLEFCNGMCFLLETAGIIHRDIKPENILLNREGTIKITDFGLAKALQSTSERAEPAASVPNGTQSDFVTQRNMIVGTLPYMSPEQYIGFQEMSAASDVYSFGVVLYEMLTGRRPFLGRTYVEWRDKHMNDLPTPPCTISNTPAELSKITMKCLEKRPDRRFRNFDELHAELESYSRATGRPHLVTARTSISELESRMSVPDWNGRGFALSQLGEHERAYECHKRALEIAPTCPLLNSNVGSVLLDLGRIEEALPYVEKEVELHPKLGLAYETLSRGYYLAEKFDQALMAIRKGAELSPDYPPILEAYALQALRAQSTTDHAQAMASLRVLFSASSVSAHELMAQAIRFCKAGDTKDGCPLRGFLNAQQVGTTMA